MSEAQFVTSREKTYLTRWDSDKLRNTHNFVFISVNYKTADYFRLYVLYMEIDKIPIVCYLNIAINDKTLTTVKKQFSECGFDDIFYHTSKSNYRNGEYTCLESHIDTYRHCLKNKCKFALIFEDDFTIDRDNIKDSLLYAHKCMLEIPDWYMIKLHQLDNKYVSVGIHNCDSVDVFNGTRCFFISKRAMKDMVLINTDNKDIEQYFTVDNIKKTKLCYVITPPLIHNTPNQTIMNRLFNLFR